jgi:PEP-CTERM motif
MNVSANGRGIKTLVAATASLFGFLLVVQPARSTGVVYTVGDMSNWGGIGLTGMDVDSEYGDGSVGQTFRIDNGNALVSSISFPLQSDSGTHPFQVGVAAWDGSQVTGPLQYLSSMLTVSGTAFETFTLTPNNLVLNQGQEYILFLTPNAFVSTSGAFNTAVGYVPSGGYTEGQYYNLVGYDLSVNDLLTQGWTGIPANMAFSINYQLATVPEPAALGLLTAGAAAFFVRRCSKSEKVSPES